MSFLQEGYTPPKNTTSDYCKFKDGVTKIRILTSPVVGYQDWNDKTPVNTREQQKPISEDRRPKHFWAMMVWNYELEMIQVLQITQASVIDGIYALLNDPDWGDPKEYDIKVTRTGKDLDTKYAITPSNKKPTPKEVTDQLESMVYDLDNLFDGTQVIISRGNLEKIEEDFDELPF